MNSRNMEQQKQEQPQQQREEEEEEEEVGLVGRQSRRRENNKPIVPVSGNKATEEEEEAEPSKELNYNDNGNGNDTAAAAAAAAAVGGLSEVNGNEEEAIQKNSVYFDSKEGNTSAEGVETNPKDELHIQSIINHHHQKDSGDKVSPCLSPLVKDYICEETSINLEHLDNNKTKVDTDVDLTEEVDQKFTEIDVEEVLQKQTTHDLYCPNCHSCITKRVIFRTRNRKVRNIRRKLKHDKFETHSAIDSNTVEATNEQSHDTPNIYLNDSLTPAADDDRQLDIFRCLSCFTFFIPTGNGFKMFWSSRDSNGDREMQDVQNIPPSNTNWFFSIFASGNRKAAIDQGKRAPDHSVAPNEDRNPVKIITPAEDAYIKSQQGVSESLNLTADSLSLEKLPMAIDQGANIPMGKETLDDPAGLDTPNQTGSFFSIGLVNDASVKPQDTQKGALTSSAKGQIPLNGVSSDVGKKPDNAVVKNNTGKRAPDHSVALDGDRNPVKIITPAEDAYIKSQQGGLESLNLTADSLLFEKLPTAIGQQTNISMGKQTLDDPAGLDTANQAGSFFSVGLVNCTSINHQETQKGVLTSSAKEQIPLNGVSSNVGKKPDNAVVKNDTGDDLIVIIETPPSDPVSSQNVDIAVPAGSLLQTQTDVGNIGAKASEAHQWDILKSIVYGGLLESITSLGIVSSAAASGASTLDILVLGLANLFGGLFIIAHNVRELKNNHYGETSTHTDRREDHYQQVLGRRENFSLHATVVVLSFLLFGLIPLLVYGFSFQKSDNRDLKIAAVAGSSLACIILLAAGKGHIQRPPRSYIRTVLYYVTIGIMTSSVSYVVGDLIKKLLEKLNLFESSLDVPIPFPETNLMKPGWASY